MDARQWVAKHVRLLRFFGGLGRGLAEPFFTVIPFGHACFSLCGGTVFDNKYRVVRDEGLEPPTFSV